jgi:putative sigma-54 modulation protein
MTNLPIHITTHHLRLRDSLRRFLRKKIAPITRFANDTIAAEIGLRRHGGAQTRFSASARLSLPGQDVRGHAVGPDLYTAIGKLVAKLGRLLRKRKTRLAKVYKHPRRREITQSDVALPFEEERSDLPKVSRSSRVREGGQEMRVFGCRRRDPLAIINQKASL